MHPPHSVWGITTCNYHVVWMLLHFSPAVSSSLSTCVLDVLLCPHLMSYPPLPVEWRFKGRLTWCWVVVIVENALLFWMRIIGWSHPLNLQSAYWYQEMLEAASINSKPRSVASELLRKKSPASWHDMLCSFVRGTWSAYPIVILSTG